MTEEYGTPIACFSLAQMSVPYDKWNGKSNLIYDGAATPFYVHGCDLKAQYKCGKFYILATEYDCPFEESVTITLLATNFKPIAKSTVPQILYPVIAAPSYFFDKIIWSAANSFNLYIKGLPHSFCYTVRNFSIPVIYAPLIRRIARPA